GAAIAAREGRAAWRRILAGTAALILLALAVIGIQLRTGWLTPAIAAVARHDPDLAGIDWTSIRPELAARGLLGADTIVAVPGWATGGKIAYALGPGARVICLSPDARQFGLDHPAARARGRSLLVLAPGRAGAADLAGYFAAFRALAPVPIRRGGQVLGWVSVGIGTGLRE
ncbi:MAG: hypothetical protein KGI51_04090, partial [Rhodospirillales bacterium]|nr:hypothetical protein [Rhodospirillales bacterium]